MYSKPGIRLFLFLSTLPLFAQEMPFAGINEPLSGADRTILEGFVGHMTAYSQGLDGEALRKKLKENGPEGFCWVEFRYLNGLLTAFEVTGDTVHLDRFRQSFALFAALLEEGPDGYLGWFGPTLVSRRPPDNPDLAVDEIQTNFRAIGILSRWVELARTQEDYAREHQATVEEYLQLTEKHLYPKWNAREHFVVIPGRGGVYRWLDYPIREGTSLSFEKLSILVEALLTLHRVTGNPDYLKRALQVGAWFKTNLILTDGRYEWMSWVPAGTWDIHPEKENAWRTGWMAPDPRGEWYAASVSIAMNLYRHGLLFEDVDVERFLKTQKEKCWNGDFESPAYRNVSGATSEHIRGRFLSLELANHDAELLRLAFDGPHAAAQLADAENSWRGGVSANTYILEKYLRRDQRQPYAAFGRTFLEDPASLAFLQQINRPVREGDAVPPRTPSVWFIQP